MIQQKKVVSEKYRIECATIGAAERGTFAPCDELKETDCFGCAKAQILLSPKAHGHGMVYRVIKITTTEEVAFEHKG